jgi:hypothetical protein
MKKIIHVLIVLSIILATCISADAAKVANAADTVNSAIKLKINNNVADLKGYNPYKSISGIMVPLAEAAKAVGASVEYISSTKEAKVELNNITLVFQAGCKFVLVNGKSLAMGENAVNNKGKIYVPVKFLYEKLGGTVGWDNKLNTVVVNIKMTAEKTAKTDPVDSSSVNVLMPATADFKPYIAELKPIPEDILAELKAYKDDKDGELIYKINGVGINKYISNTDLQIRVGFEELKRQCVAAKSMLEVENNVNYRTISNNFIQQYRYFFTPLSETGEVTTDINLIVHRYEDIKKYNIVQKAEFYTDPSLIYVNKNGETRIRGKLKFVFESVDKQYFKDHLLPEYELNKWYESDLEIEFGIFMSKYWDLWFHSYYTYMNRFYLNSSRLSYDK